MNGLGQIRQARGVRWSLAADTANAAFSQLVLGGAFFVLFLSEMGLSKTQIGFVASLLPIAGILALFVVPLVAGLGYKRAFLTFWGVRKVVISFMLCAPAILARFGIAATFFYVAGIFAVFSVCRAIAETAYNPWTLEFVPNSIRGQFQALVNILATLSSLAAVAVGSYLIGHIAGLARFQYVIGAGLLCAWIAWVAATFIPGGAPNPQVAVGRANHARIWEAVRDKNLQLFLAGEALFMLGMAPLSSFVPLFMKEQVRLDAQQVVFLQNGALVGALLSSYLWGWLADRYGGKWIMLAGILVRCLLPLCWLLMPRGSASSEYIALGAACFEGVANTGWAVGSTRLLFINIVPAERKTEYLAVHYAWAGCVGGVGPLLAGVLLDQLRGVSGRWFIFALDPYTALFVISLGLMLFSLFVLQRVRADGAFPLRRLARQLIGKP